MIPTRPAHRSRTLAARLRRARARQGHAGFTLVELLVAMVAGLIVSLAIVGLSREATYSFHEEMRTATAEMSVRTAVERLKSDIQRAGYMSTGNVYTDLRMPLDRTADRVPGGSSANFIALAGLNYYPGGSAAATPLSTSGDNAYSPDAIDITGNFTSSDQFVVARLGTSAACAGPRLLLSKDSAATYRMMTAGNAAAVDAAFKSTFQPVAGERFLVRIADDLGRHQVVAGCPSQTAGYDGTNAWIDLESAFPYLTTAYGFVDGRLTVNPVQTVRWEIRPLTSADTTYAAIATDPAAEGGVSKKYNLVRSWVGSDNVALKPAEMIAEYVVDLKFAFTADLGNYLADPPVPTFVSYAFGAAGNTTVGKGNTLGARPERIRAVRVRLSTRAAQPDRNEDLRLEKNAYTVRYCMEETCTPGSRHWARVRTVTTEVALPNQARNFY